MDIDYNKLKSFLAVVECGSITAAAESLHRTQSAVSQTLQKLEQNLGLTLIEWEGKRLKLTRDGQLVYRAINQRMKAIDEQLSTIINAGVEVGGCIELGVLQDHSTQIQEHLLSVLSKFRNKYPAVTFRINFGTSAEIEQALFDQELDIGLLINFKEQYRFNTFALATEEHLIVSSSDYLKQAGPFKDLKSVISADLIDTDEAFTCFTPWIKKHEPALVQELEKKKPAIVISDFRAAKELVLFGQGISVLPRYLIENELASGKLVQVLPKISTLQVEIDCAGQRGRKERLCDQLFIEALTQN